MIARHGGIVICLVAVAFTGCSTPDSLEGERTVCNNPHAVPTVEQTGIGPQCDVNFGRDATCLGAPLVYPGGRYVLLGNGDTEALTRQQRRILLERAELLEALREGPPTVPLPQPKAEDAQDTP